MRPEGEDDPAADGLEEIDRERMRVRIAELEALLDAAAKPGTLERELVERDRMLRERERAARIASALTAAVTALSAATGSREAIYHAASDALEAHGLRTVLWDVDHAAAVATLKDVRVGRHLRYLEGLAGTGARGFAARLEDVPPYAEAIRSRRPTFVRDAVELMRGVLGPKLSWLASPTVRMVRMGRLVVAPIVHDDRVTGLFIVMADWLEPSDGQAVGAFTTLMAEAAHRARLMSELEASLEELRRTQGQLLHAQKMKAVGQLAGGVAHDFNNLLTAILGSASLLRPRLQDDPEARGELDVIDDASHRAAALVRQLLAFSRPSAPSAGRVSDLDDLLRQLHALLVRTIGEAHRIEVHHAAVPCPVELDAGNLEQMVLNFVLNARDAMPEGGTIAITTRHHVMDDGSRFVVLEVSDDGEGMDEATLARVFEPFFTTKPPGKGTGLGLAVAYGVVTQLGGRIEIESGPGRGTTVRTWLPLASGACGSVLTPRAASRASSPAAAEGSILLVEDEATVVAVVSRALRGAGYTVRTAPTLAGARGALGDGRIELVVSDVRLPDGSGLDLVPAVRERSLPIVFSSGYLDSQGMDGRLEGLGIPFLRKPYPMAELLEVVARELTRSRSDRAV